ncbi:MAG TPA: hypothetical protein VHS03_07180 [Gaiellaceae bacterium]|jgi:hypothetical protein|nr:hypothetical protein [Gaiellaceae bacterium]
MIQRALSSAYAAILPALIQDARDHQRRRQAALAKTAALTIALVLAGAAGRGGSSDVQALALSDPAAAAIRADVARTISTFDRAVAAGDFASACRLLDPDMGVVTVRSATSAAGLGGSCGQRLAGFVRIIGPTLLAKLEKAPVVNVEYGGSESRGYEASASIVVADEATRLGTWIPVVGVSKANGHARALITCPPLLCAWRFLAEYPELARAES